MTVKVKTRCSKGLQSSPYNLVQCVTGKKCWKRDVHHQFLHCTLYWYIFHGFDIFDFSLIVFPCCQLVLPNKYGLKLMLNTLYNVYYIYTPLSKSLNQWDIRQSIKDQVVSYLLCAHGSWITSDCSLLYMYMFLRTFLRVWLLNECIWSGLWVTMGRLNWGRGLWPCFWKYRECY